MLEGLTSLAVAIKDCSLLNWVQQGFMVKGGKSSWVTCVEARSQQTVRLVFKKPSKTTKLQPEGKNHRVQESKVSPQQRAALLPKWDLDAKVQEWACHLFRGKATTE